MAGDSLIMQTGRAYQVSGDAFNGNLNATIDYLQLPDSSVANCDKLFRQFFHGEKVDRYSTVYVRFALSGTSLYVAQAPSQDGSAIAAGTPTYEFFNTGLRPGPKGQTDHLYSAPPSTPGATLIPGEGSPWVLSKSDTDGLDAVDNRSQGADLTSSEQVDFFISSVGFEMVGIYEAVTNPMASPTDGTIARQRSAWAYREQGAYAKRIAEYLIRHATGRIARQGELFAQNGQDYNLGPIGDWTSYAEFFGGGNSSGGQPVPYALKLLPLPLLAGRAPKLVNANRFRFLLDVDSVGVIDSDAVNPIPAALSSGISGQSPFVNSIFVGVRLKLTGGMICIDKSGKPLKQLSGVCLSADQIKAMRDAGLSEAQIADVAAKAPTTAT